HAVGLAGRGHDVSADTFGLFGKPFDKRAPVADFATGLGDGFALLQCHDLGQVFGVGDDQVKPFAQNASTFLAGACTPAFESLVGRRDGGLGLVCFKVGQLGYGLPVGGVIDREGAVVGGLNPFTIYI